MLVLIKVEYLQDSHCQARDPILQRQIFDDEIPSRGRLVNQLVPLKHYIDVLIPALWEGQVF